jgi:hypothetical protein
MKTNEMAGFPAIFVSGAQGTERFACAGKLLSRQRLWLPNSPSSLVISSSSEGLAAGLLGGGWECVSSREVSSSCISVSSMESFEGGGAYRVLPFVVVP